MFFTKFCRFFRRSVDKIPKKKSAVSAQNADLFPGQPSELSGQQAIIQLQCAHGQPLEVENGFPAARQHPLDLMELSLLQRYQTGVRR